MAQEKETYNDTNEKPSTRLPDSATWGFPDKRVKDVHPTSTSSGTTLVDRTERKDWPDIEELESLG